MRIGLSAITAVSVFVLGRITSAPTYAQLVGTGVIRMDYMPIYRRRIRTGSAHS